MSIEQIKKDIHKGNATWIEAFKQQDADMLANVFHEEGATFGANGKVTLGRSAVKEAMGSWMQSVGKCVFTIDTDEVYVIEEEIYEIGHYSLTKENKEYFEGKFVVVWKYGDDGKLYFYRNMDV
jgi:uncharacterized protein (TIGR02246 family)